MERRELIGMIENGTSIVRSFLATSDPSSFFGGSYEDWNNGDVIGHICGWMDYSIDKLTSLKRGTKPSDEYNDVSSLDEINKILYAKTRNASRETLEAGYRSSVDRYLETIGLFSDADINADTFDTGFKMDLWRYMLMDTVIHPVQHVLYQYLKKGAHDKLVAAITRGADAFGKYAEGNKAWELSEFRIDRAEYQEKLGRMDAEYGGNKLVQAFVRANNSKPEA